jgi:hypothetical protein
MTMKVPYMISLFFIILCLGCRSENEIPGIEVLILRDVP